MELLPSPNDRQSQNYADLLQLAYQGDAQAIASLMNRNLKQRQITAKVGWEGTCLHVFLEAAQVLPPEPLASVIHKTVLKIQVKNFQSLKVSFWQSGAPQCAWSQERAIAQSPAPQTTVPAAPLDRPQSTSANSISLADWFNQRAQAEPLEHADPRAADSKEPELRFLRFSFSLTETALLPLISIRQVLNVQFQNILPVPAMPAAVVGIYNFRGEMLWVVDLGLQIGFQGVITRGNSSTQISSWAAPLISGQLRQLSSYVVIIIQAQGKSLGLLVPDVIDIESHNPQQLQSPESDLFPPGLTPFLQGYLVRSSSPILDASALINDRRLQVHAA